MDEGYIMSSILKSGKDQGLPATFRFCRDDKKRGKLLFSDVDNLKALVKTTMGNVVVRSRRDLKTIADWTNFCQAVSNGFAYLYGFDKETLEVKTAFDFPPHEDVCKFTIIGMPPESNTKLFHFSAFTVRQQKNFHDIESESSIVFCGAYKAADVVEWYVSEMMKASSNRSLAKFLTITDGKTLNVHKELKDDDKLEDSLRTHLQAVSFEHLTNADVKLITDLESWRTVLKMTKLTF